MASATRFAIAKAIPNGAAIAEKRLLAIPSQGRCRKEEDESGGGDRGGAASRSRDQRENSIGQADRIFSNSEPDAEAPARLACVATMNRGTYAGTPAGTPFNDLPKGDAPRSPDITIRNNKNVFYSSY
jgi:hypothetical protein